MFSVVVLPKTRKTQIVFKNHLTSVKAEDKTTTFSRWTVSWGVQVCCCLVDSDVGLKEPWSEVTLAKGKAFCRREFKEKKERELNDCVVAF